MIPKYKDRSLSVEERVDDLIARMTPEEKVGQMMQISFISVSKEEAEEWITERCAGSFLHALGDDAVRLQEIAMGTRLGIPLLFGIDAVRGHALYNGATIFPTQLAMACSWNPELVKKAGSITAKEVAADGLHWTFSPILCLGRDLRWGRINETFGEDPYLAGELAASIIQGYQGDSLSDPDSILACAKHYIAYGEATGGRDAYDAQISIRKVRDVFLPPFRKAVEAGCATFMSSYQSIDGTPVTANKKVLRKLLKEELGFDGFVVTDWNNVGSLICNQHVAGDMETAARKAIEAGNDMIMTTNEFYEAAVSLVRKGTVSEELIDEAVRRILRVKFRLGLFDGKAFPVSGRASHVIGCKEHLDTALEITRESIVLLENRNDTLPLDNSVRSIAVIGPNADDIQSHFGDWTFLSHPQPKPDEVPKLPVHTILSGIRELAGKRGISVAYHRGCDIMDKDDANISGAVECASGADVIIAVVGDCLAQNGEFKDRADLALSGNQQKLLESLRKCGKPLIVVLVNGKPLAIPWIAENADAVLEAFNPGMFGGKAVAEIIFGELNPSGKLPISFPYHSGQLPVYYNQLPGWHGGRYMDMPERPLYSFGYGLSFSRYEYSNLRLSHTTCTADDTVTVYVDVTNNGPYDGRETVQLYVNDVVSSVVTPVRQLKGFVKTEIRSGETKTVEIRLPVGELYIVDENENQVVEPGEFEILVGPDSRPESLLKAVLTVV
jgi:beta-glucosidase